MSTAESPWPTIVAGSAAAAGSRQRARVYISSSALDLQEARATVIAAIRRSGCEAVAMESYGADSRPPIERCLRDVGSCAVYVGIVAFRYGSCPPGERRSFTELEYDEAVRSRKQILLFHLDEDAPWPTRHVDPSRHDVDRLRSRQKTNHVVDTFATLDQLSTGVRQALRRLYGAATEPVPALLPYVVDRHRQVEYLAEAASRHVFDRSPSLVVVHGVVGQAHHKFVEYMQEQLLGRYLGAAGPVHITPIALRSGELDQPDIITRRIAVSCALTPTVDIDILAGQLHDFGSTTMLRFPVEVELRRGRPQVRLLAELVGYFARWPSRRPLRVLPVISAQYREPSGWGARLGWSAPDPNRIARAVEAAATSTTTPVVVLPELTNIEEHEVEVWAERTEVRRFLDGRDPVPAIRRMFEAYRRSSNDRGIPMETLAVMLDQLLHEPSSREGAA
jgi:hypothetical protein